MTKPSLWQSLAKALPQAMVEPQASLEESVVVEASPRWVTVQVSHGHKFRVGEWMERRFPGSERIGNGRMVTRGSRRASLSRWSL